MNNGVMEQVGTPFEIYNFPATEFVAHFVGTLNAVEAEIVDPTNRILSIDGQHLQTHAEMPRRQPGDKVTVSIRPERLSFSSEGKKPNLIDCTVENITFLGSIVRIQIRLDKTLLNMDTFNNPFLELPKIGDPIEVNCSREAELVLNREL